MFEDSHVSEFSFDSDVAGAHGGSSKIWVGYGQYSLDIMVPGPYFAFIISSSDPIQVVLCPSLPPDLIPTLLTTLLTTVPAQFPLRQGATPYN